MKQFLFLVFAASFILSCNSEQKSQPLDQAAIDKVMADSGNYTSIQWLDSTVNFGVVEENAKVNVKFRYKNTGNKPLLIADVIPTCGCTVPEFKKEFVQPGNEGEITAQFNSMNQHTPVSKTITVRANTIDKQEHFLTFTGEIKKSNQ